MQEAYDRIVARDPDQKEFLQAVEEVFTSLAPVIEKKPEYAAVLERIAEPERQIAFRVPWFDDKGTLHINRGYRIQTNSALGPYKVPTCAIGQNVSMVFVTCMRHKACLHLCGQEQTVLSKSCSNGLMESYKIMTICWYEVIRSSCVCLGRPETCP